MDVPFVLKYFQVVLLDMLVKTGFVDTDISVHLLVYLNGLHMFQSKVISVPVWFF